ncbi:MAG: ABC transporter substrate-binding protein [Bdellovibrionota bacterium]
MKFIYAFFLLFVSSIAWAQINKPKVLVCADAGYPPYSFGEKNSKIADGIYNKIIEKVFEKMKDDYDITLEPFPWQRAVIATKNGDAFGLVPPYKSYTERPWLEYSEPILTEQLVVVCSDKDGKWPESYAGKNIVINNGFVLTKEIYNVFAGHDIHQVTSKNNEQGLEFLFQNKASCYLSDKNSIYYSLKQMKLSADKVHLKSVVASIDGHFGYSTDSKKFPFGKEFIKKFNAILLEMKKKGEVEKIVNSVLK